MTKKTILAAFAALVLMCSCSTSDSALNDLRTLNQQITIEGPTYGLNDWRSAATKYYKTDKKIAKFVADGKYTDAEMQEIGELQGSCVSGFAKGLGQNISNKARNAASLIKGLVNGLKEGFTK